MNRMIFTVAFTGFLTGVPIGYNNLYWSSFIDSPAIMNDHVNLPCAYDGPEWPSGCELGINVVVYNDLGVYASLESAILEADSIAQWYGHACVEILEGEYNENVNLTGIDNISIYGHGLDTVINGTMAFGDFSNIKIEKLRVNATQGSSATGLMLIAGVNAGFEYQN